jgi:hypothetical protein
MKGATVSLLLAIGGIDDVVVTASAASAESRAAHAAACS